MSPCVIDRGWAATLCSSVWLSRSVGRQSHITAARARAIIKTTVRSAFLFTIMKCDVVHVVLKKSVVHGGSDFSDPNPNPSSRLDRAVSTRVGEESILSSSS